MNINWRKLLNYTSIIGVSSFGIGLLILLFSSLPIMQRYTVFDSQKYIAYVNTINKTLKPFINSPKQFHSDWELKQYEDTLLQNNDSNLNFNLDPFFVTQIIDSLKIYTLKIDTLTQEEINKIKELAEKHYDNLAALEKKLQDITGKDFLRKYSIYESYAYSTVDHSETFLTISFYFIAGILLTIIAFPFLSFLKDKQSIEVQGQLYADAKKRLEDNPGEIKPAWDMAQLTLEQYFGRNLKQINMIFKVSVGVMTVGFALIAVGVGYAISEPTNTSIQIVSVGSGILTEFIGATFIFIYNSTVKQAITYTDSLEQINSVGMSIKILDSIKVEDGNKDNLNNAKIEIAKMLIQRANGNPS